ncbi:hypothetical protein ACWDYH_31490 [Nocardia goodfellowii]
MPTDDEERRRMRDAAAKRDREERQRAKERGRKHNDQGRWFHKGLANHLGHTRENGYQNESVIKTSLSERKHDTARDREGEGRKFNEYKSGRDIRADALMQLAKDKEILEKDARAEGVWHIRADATIDPMARRQMDKMQQLFPGRYKVERYTREEVHRFKAIGRDIERQERSPQLELVDSDKLRKQERARQRAERAREAANTRAAAARAVAEKEERDRARQREQQEREFRERLPHLPPEVLRLMVLGAPLPGEQVRETPDPSSGADSTRAGRKARGIEKGGREGRQRS